MEKKTEEQVGGTLQDLSQMQELLKDFNHFSDLFQTQQSLAEQNKAYNTSTQLGREDQLALKNLAANSPVGNLPSMVG